MANQEPSIVVRGRLMVLRTDGRIMNTTGLSVSSGQYLFGSATRPFANR